MSVKENLGVVQVEAALGRLPGVKLDPLTMLLVPPAQGRMVICLHTHMKYYYMMLNTLEYEKVLMS
jgi:hypothetical protein